MSIVTASRDALPDLKKTVASVASQSFTDYEHIVVDGGSTDGTTEWLATAGSRLKWISEADRGIADALNKGVKLARGEWLLVLQAADTLIDQHSLARAVPALDPEVDVVCFDVLFDTQNGTRRLTSRGFSPRINFKPIPHQGAFTNRALFERVGGFDPDLRLHLDYDFYLRAHRAGATAVVAGEPLSRMPDTGVTSRLDWPSLKERFKEERTIHLRNCSGAGQRIMYSAYWPLYLMYRRLRAGLSSAGGASGGLVSDPIEPHHRV